MKFGILCKISDYRKKIGQGLKNIHFIHEAIYSPHKSGLHNGEKFVHFLNMREGNRNIFELLNSGQPTMIARHGATELEVAVSFDWEYSISGLDTLCFNGGFFPNDKELAEDWAELYLESSREIDCLCDYHHKWGRYSKIQHLFSKYSPNATLINDLNVINPFFIKKPWTRYLRGKRVLIISPFVDTIKSQYKKRKNLFADEDILPDFESLSCVKAVQTSAGNEDSRFNTWFEAYEYMLDEIRQKEFDVALVSCGAYGLPLAAQIKKMGKQAVLMGGSLQLLFGIRGSRWDDKQHWISRGLFNEHWVRPSKSEKPEKAGDVEDSAYW